MSSPKGTRKDTPAHVQIPNNLRLQMEKTSLGPSIKDEDIEESSAEIIENQIPTKESKMTTNRSRKPTPAHVQNLNSSKTKKKTISFDEDILEQDEEETVENICTDTTEIKCVEKSPKAHRKDTPAAIRMTHKSPTKARSLCSKDSITEEDENEGDTDDTMTSYRIRKQSILLCSHPSLEK